MIRSRITVFVALLTSVTAARADVKLPPLVGDNMVLQPLPDRGTPVWGTAEPGERVSVKFLDRSPSVEAGADGKWQVALDLKGVEVGKPFEMTVVGNNSITVKNVVVGEVWVCSGQSNMEWRVSNSNDAKAEVAAADFPMIRHFEVKKATPGEPATTLGGEWKVCTPANAGNFTAVGYYFGREVHRQLNVPVGLINTSWGGTPAQAWTSREALAARPELKHYADRFDKAMADFPAAREKHKAVLAEWDAKYGPAALKAAAATNPTTSPVKPPNRPGPPPGPGNQNTPTVLFNGMIAPVIPYAVRGATWYQGESNAGAAAEYDELLAAMIADWRGRWGQGDFPFYVVQLANYMGRADRPTDTAWARLRESQATVARTTPNAGLAVAIDVGEEKDIHPRDKQSVGKRLALVALAQTYGKPIEFAGPTFDQLSVDAGAARVTFTHADGLTSKDGPPTGFAIAGDDKQWHWADATIDGATVVLRSTNVPKPVAVRYAWANNPACNLYNAAGLPMVPFRTDDWAMGK